ncbi:tetraprenyl-beta-curcumene synthase family protein [Salisediminibacterium halotolerans]|uniref:Tetraprenyl-beta-curcumene synthase n=1 Tax=Salisediminibacterium halotolerans TaxID=517425 RepID=A0A1H9UX91_9BACI|nr:tetraprenyl-beta-curcumene synthase [Salisediminibacterium haloalkalitolerans]
MNIPLNSPVMMYRIYKRVLPAVHRELAVWRNRAENIPDPELRSQALASIADKTFHCEGGAIYALLAGEKFSDAVSFIVSYQTISDYLDNLCDRSTSLNPLDFTALHEALTDALQPGVPVKRYYRFRAEQDDGGYLEALVKNCQEKAGSFPFYRQAKPYTLKLASLYGDLQIHKHVAEEERVKRLTSWHKAHPKESAELSWYEFSAAAGSTLGIFCLVSYAAGSAGFTALDASRIYERYFPWMQGLHIMLDYFIDQDEDERGGDLNFCFYYPDEAALIHGLTRFYHRAVSQLQALPDAGFHRRVAGGLLAIYLADPKVKENGRLKRRRRRILTSGGKASVFFYLNGWVYRRLSKT